jgi:translation initiation factor 2 beta subunit (eIF-2beta)/eIF-5
MSNQMIIAAPSIRHDGYRGISPLVIVNPINNGRVITSEVLVTCHSCNEESRITRKEADNGWTFQCQDCGDRYGSTHD